MRTEFKTFLATFSLSFAALFIIHLVVLPFYWANASPQQARPSDLYLPSAWTPTIVFYSVLIAVVAVAAVSLFSRMGRGKADETTIFITTFFLSWVLFWVLFALGALRWGNPMRLGSYWDLDSKSGYANALFTSFFSFVGAFFVTVVFEFYRLIRPLRKRQVKENA